MLFDAVGSGGARQAAGYFIHNDSWALRAPGGSLPPFRAPLEDVVVTPLLCSRPSRRADWQAESAALADLSIAAFRCPNTVLKRLAALGVELCRAGTAGVSVLEDDGAEQIFRWRALAGQLERFEGGHTPRDWSPCGSCLDAGRPMLYSFPSRRFSYFDEIPIPIVEGLVIPMYTSGTPIGTIWIVSHTAARAFDAEDVRIMTSLGRFAATVLRASLAPEPPRPDAGDEGHGREAVWNGYILQIARNDQAALAELFTETGPVLFHCALRVLGHAADAEEIVSDVLIRVWRTAHSYRPGGSVLGWLLVITRNLSFDRLRARASESRCAEALWAECAGAAAAEASAASASWRKRLSDALNALPADQKRALELAYFSELSHVAIAALLEEPLDTVKARIRLGLMRLRLHLAA